MKIVQAEAVAARLWNRNDKDGWAQSWIHRRISKSPRFVVGYTTYEKGRTTRHTMGGSNVDWESAFFVAANESPKEIARVFEAIKIETASPALRVACPKCGEDPGDECRSETRRGAPRQSRPHNERFAAARNTNKDQP